MFPVVKSFFKNSSGHSHLHFLTLMAKIHIVEIVNIAISKNRIFLFFCIFFFGFRYFLVFSIPMSVSVLFFGRSFIKWFALCCRSVACLSVLSVTLVYSGQTVGRIKMKLGIGRPRPWPHCVRWDPAPLRKRGRAAPNFWPISVATKWLDGSRCHLVGRSASAQLSDFVLDGDAAPPA